MKQFGIKKLSALLLSAALMVTALSACGGTKAPARGTWDGNVYTNEYLGLSFNMPDGWVASTDDELAAQMEAATVDVLGENYDKESVKYQTIMEMSATDPDTGSNVLICYENLKLSNSTSMTEAEYLTAAAEEANSAYESYGLTSNLSDVTEVDLFGNSWQVITVELSADEISITQSYYARKIDNYMGAMVITESNTEAVINHFS